MAPSCKRLPLRVEVCTPTIKCILPQERDTIDVPGQHSSGAKRFNFIPKYYAVGLVDENGKLCRPKRNEFKVTYEILEVKQKNLVLLKSVSLSKVQCKFFYFFGVAKFTVPGCYEHRFRAIFGKNTSFEIEPKIFRVCAETSPGIIALEPASVADSPGSPHSPKRKITSERGSLHKHIKDNSAEKTLTKKKKSVFEVNASLSSLEQITGQSKQQLEPIGYNCHVCKNRKQWTKQCTVNRILTKTGNIGRCLVYFCIGCVKRQGDVFEQVKRDENWLCYVCSRRCKCAACRRYKQSSEEIMWVESCLKCDGDNGELVCCDMCPGAFHPNCIGIAPDSLPDVWHCSFCTQENSEGFFHSIFFAADATANPLVCRSLIGITKYLRDHPLAQLLEKAMTDCAQQPSKDLYSLEEIIQKLELNTYTQLEAALNDIQQFLAKCQTINGEGIVVGKTQVFKPHNGMPSFGMLVAYNRPFYTAMYEDGKSETLDLKEVLQFMTKSNQDQRITYLSRSADRLSIVFDRFVASMNQFYNQDYEKEIFRLKEQIKRVQEKTETNAEEVWHSKQQLLEKESQVHALEIELESVKQSEIKLRDELEVTKGKVLSDDISKAVYQLVSKSSLTNPQHDEKYLCAIEKALVKALEDTRSAKEDLRSKELCCVCADQKSNVVLIPCHHLCVCTPCSNHPTLKECPICRKSIENRIRIFV